MALGGRGGTRRPAPPLAPPPAKARVASGPVGPAGWEAGPPGARASPRRRRAGRAQLPAGALGAWGPSGAGGRWAPRLRARGQRSWPSSQGRAPGGRSLVCVVPTAPSRGNYRFALNQVPFAKGVEAKPAFGPVRPLTLTGAGPSRSVLYLEETSRSAQGRLQARTLRTPGCPRLLGGMITSGRPSHWSKGLAFWETRVTVLRGGEGRSLWRAQEIRLGSAALIQKGVHLPLTAGHLLSLASRMATSSSLSPPRLLQSWPG